jgi:hypothetical protein
MRLYVLTAASLEIVVLWDVAPYSLVKVDRSFIGVYVFHHQGGRPETSVIFCETTRRNIPDEVICNRASSHQPEDVLEDTNGTMVICSSYLYVQQSYEVSWL